MTYLQLEQMVDTEAVMTAAGYSPVAVTTLRLDEQDRLGTGFQATAVSGLGMTPVTISTTPNQVGATARFVRRLPRDIDLSLSIHAADLADREAKEAKLYSILSGECILRKCEEGSTGIALPATYKYLRVFYVGGGNYTLGDGQTSDNELELVITLRAHKPDWKTGG